MRLLVGPIIMYFCVCIFQSRPSLLGNPMIAQANMMLQASNLMNMMSSNPQNAQNINVNVIANFNQLVNTLQGMGDAFMGKDNSGELGDGKTGTRGLGNESGSNAPKGLLGDHPFSNPSGSLLGNGPRSSQARGPANGGGMGPANPLLALFLEQQIRQQITWQQAQTQATINQMSDLVSNSLKRRHGSVNNNSESGGLLPTPNNESNALLPTPGGAVRSLFGQSNDRGSLLPTPDDEDDNDENPYDGPIPPLMHSFVSSGTTTQDDLNSPAKKFPKMEGSKGGLLGDMPESIKQSILGTSAAADNANKENYDFDPSTGFWANQVKQPFKVVLPTSV